jgi:hypothetical protein
MIMEPKNEHASEHTIHLPSPTAMPMVLALGVMLLGAGLVTSWVISLLGLLLIARASVGWFREVLPHESHEEVPVTTEMVEIKSTRSQVARLPLGKDHRKILPVETFTLGAGVKGGIAGGIAMVLPAGLYGLIRYHSLWYPANLLAAFVIPDWATRSVGFLSTFHLRGLLLAIVIHGGGSVLVGLLYGAILPMFPRKPILTAGFLAPFFWTGLLYATLQAVSPALTHRIDWVWFILSQIAFGLVAGFVVNLHVRVRTDQFQSLPFAVRAGIESQGMGDEREDRSQ